MSKVIESLRAHFEDEFSRLGELSTRGARFTELAAIDFPQDYNLRYILQLELWDQALASNASNAFHALALHTDDEFVSDALKIAVSAHNKHAVLCLFAKLVRIEPEDSPLIRLIQCSVAGCTNCADARRHVFETLKPRADIQLGETMKALALERGVYDEWRIKMRTNPATDFLS